MYVRGECTYYIIIIRRQSCVYRTIRKQYNNNNDKFSNNIQYVHYTSFIRTHT